MRKMKKRKEDRVETRREDEMTEPEQKRRDSLFATTTTHYVPRVFSCCVPINIHLASGFSTSSSKPVLLFEATDTTGLLAVCGGI
jgi:hypothetical protein